MSLDFGPMSLHWGKFADSGRERVIRKFRHQVHSIAETTAAGAVTMAVFPEIAGEQFVINFLVDPGISFFNPSRKSKSLKSRLPTFH